MSGHNRGDERIFEYAGQASNERRALIPTSKIDPKHPERLGIRAVATYDDGPRPRLGSYVQNDYPCGDDAAVQHHSGLRARPRDDLTLASRFQNHFPDIRVHPIVPTAEKQTERHGSEHPEPYPHRQGIRQRRKPGQRVNGRDGGREAAGPIKKKT
jgi:hypothetical protein